ncbi:hypothetical protein VQL36_16185 [Chengkuizengella sp. SCS-71B]|uniref:hypothetical protein n=1 Tax=Chengkuizengella sp. SCS-71B TaxID=3115290 RepID=UPI0032C21526
MGVFDKSKCDCCVCPMQCVLEQLVGVQNVTIAAPTFASVGVIINQVKNFIAFTSGGDIPICQITGVATLDPTIPVNLKPIKKSNGECACCEGPIINVAKSLIGQNVEIEFISIGDAVIVKLVDVGEGIVVGKVEDETDFFSSCAITRINPTNQQQFNGQSGFLGFYLASGG